MTIGNSLVLKRHKFSTKLKGLCLILIWGTVASRDAGEERIGIYSQRVTENNIEYRLSTFLKQPWDICAQPRKQYR